MSENKIVEVLVSGGSATAGPPLGPALGPLGVNVLAIVNKINEETENYAGMKVPVKIFIDINTKNFNVEIGIPTTAALIVKEAGIQKGANTSESPISGNMSLEQTMQIAKSKQSNLLSPTLKSAVKEITGTCMSMGVTLNQTNAKAIMKAIDAGEYDDLFE
jgi:large subunit ribosomal protein L11